jgi:hypothetical protein
MLFRSLPEGLGTAAEIPGPEPTEPIRDQCLRCALATLLAHGGVETSECERVRGVINKAQSVSTSTLHTRATIYHCGAIGCEHTMMTITGVETSVLPDNPNDMQLHAVPGSTDCVLPKEA